MATGDGAGDVAPAAGGAESPVMETLKLGIKAVGVGVSGSKAREYGAITKSNAASVSSGIAAHHRMVGPPSGCAARLSSSPAARKRVFGSTAV